jgi:hypothetical protein
MQKKKKWSDLSSTERAVVVAMSSVQIVLLLAALTDIARRPAAAIRGPRWLWLLVSFVNFVGPITYFVAGRKPQR